MKKAWKWCIPAVSVAVLILGAIPGSVVMRFIGDPATGSWFYSYVTYYSGINLGYGNIFPALTMLLSAATALRSLRIFRKKSDGKALLAWNIAAVLAAWAPAPRVGLAPIGWTILGLLLAQTALIFAYYRIQRGKAA